MDKKLSFLNFFLILITISLVSWLVKVWVKPEFPSKIDGASLTGSPKSLEEFAAKRNTYPASTVSVIVERNIFRKERNEFKVIDPAQARGAAGAATPPPEVTLRATLLTGRSKVAVMEGNYYVSGSNSEKKPIKKRGYTLGDYIGDYQVTDIATDSVTLADKGGQSVNSKLSRKNKTPIKREGNALTHKPPKKGDAEPAAHASGAQQPVAPAISGAPSPAPAAAPHISGN